VKASHQVRQAIGVLHPAAPSLQYRLRPVERARSSRRPARVAEARAFSGERAHSTNRRAITGIGLSSGFRPASMGDFATAIDIRVSSVHVPGGRREAATKSATPSRPKQAWISRGETDSVGRPSASPAGGPTIVLANRRSSRVFTRHVSFP